MPLRVLRFVPLLSQIRNYERSDARGDLTAGLTTAVMLIPQAMGYAMLAGLNPIYGLYSAVLPLVLYAVVGTSRQLAVGPVALDSLLVAAGVSALVAPSAPEYALYATLLALLVGMTQVAMGVARLGFLVNFLSQPVISGFTSAAALIIGLSQLKHVLGFDIPRSDHVHTILVSAWDRLGETHLPSLLVGVSSIAVLLTCKKLSRRIPGALLVVAAATLIVAVFQLDGVAVVGRVPAGLPPLELPRFDFATDKLIPITLTIALVGFMEAIAVAKKYAALNRYEVDANRELVGIGLANVAAGFSSGYPVTGGLSRTAVNAEAGARTGLASLVTAGVVSITLLFITPLFRTMPNAALAAIIMTAVFGLIDVKSVKYLWRVKRQDLAMLVVTFLATLVLGIQHGVLIGVAASLLQVLYASSRPHIAVVGRLPETGIYRNTRRYPEAEEVPGVLALRLDSDLYFANIAFLKDSLRALETHTLTAVVLDASGINQIDASAELALREILEGYEGRGIRFMMSNLKGPVRDVLRRSGFYAVIGPDNVFDTLELAMATLRPSPRPHPQRFA
ncbi:MAG: solute carrier family 26 protein [Myxococcota bacterium]